MGRALGDEYWSARGLAKTNDPNRVGVTIRVGVAAGAMVGVSVSVGKMVGEGAVLTVLVAVEVID